MEKVDAATSRLDSLRARLWRHCHSPKRTHSVSNAFLTRDGTRTPKMNENRVHLNLRDVARLSVDCTAPAEERTEKSKGCQHLRLYCTMSLRTAASSPPAHAWTNAARAPTWPLRCGRVRSISATTASICTSPCARLLANAISGNQRSFPMVAGLLLKSLSPQLGVGAFFWARGFNPQWWTTPNIIHHHHGVPTTLGETLHDVRGETKIRTIVSKHSARRHLYLYVRTPLGRACL
jgi:hypothetical protein